MLLKQNIESNISQVALFKPNGKIISTTAAVLNKIYHNQKTNLLNYDSTITYFVIKKEESKHKYLGF
jgi:hypothetical protein